MTHCRSQVPFGIRRFNLFSKSVSSSVFLNFRFPRFVSLPLSIPPHLRFGSYRCRLSLGNIHSRLTLQIIRPFALTDPQPATSTSADFSTFLVTMAFDTVETSRDKHCIFHRLPAWFTHQGYGCLWELRCLLPSCPLDTPWYHVSVRQATISLSLLPSQASPPETCESLRGSSATTPLMDFHHRYRTCPSYMKMRKILAEIPHR